MLRIRVFRHLFRTPLYMRANPCPEQKESDDDDHVIERLIDKDAWWIRVPEIRKQDTATKS